MATRRSGPPIDFTGRRRRRRQRLLRTGGVALGVVVAAGAVYAVTHKGSLPGPFGGPGKPERPSFTFRFASVKGYKLGESSPSNGATEKAAKDVQHTLSEFYIDTILDPNSWADGVPKKTWNVFTPAARKEALRHASSFTLGNVARSLKSLSVSGSALSVRVLFGPTGKAAAATAVAALRARGKTTAGQRVEVTNRGGFFLKPSSGKWLIVGFPKVRTSVQSKGQKKQGASP